MENRSLNWYKENLIKMLVQDREDIIFSGKIDERVLKNIDMLINTLEMTDSIVDDRVIVYCYHVYLKRKSIDDIIDFLCFENSKMLMLGSVICSDNKEIVVDRLIKYDEESSEQYGLDIIRRTTYFAVKDLRTGVVDIDKIVEISSIYGVSFSREFYKLPETKVRESLLDMEFEDFYESLILGNSEELLAKYDRRPLAFGITTYTDYINKKSDIYMTNYSDVEDISNAYKVNLDAISGPLKNKLKVINDTFWDKFYDADWENFTEEELGFVQFLGRKNGAVKKIYLLK